VPQGTGGVLLATPFICGMIRCGAAAVAEQRIVVSCQWSVASNRAACGRRRAADKAPPDKFNPSPGGAVDFNAGGVRTSGTAFYHTCALEREYPQGAGRIAGYLREGMGTSTGGTVFTNKEEN
jgi:hypothetical protein